LLNFEKFLAFFIIISQKIKNSSEVYVWYKLSVYFQWKENLNLGNTTRIKSECDKKKFSTEVISHYCLVSFKGKNICVLCERCWWELRYWIENSPKLKLTFEVNYKKLARNERNEKTGSQNRFTEISIFMIDKTHSMSNFVYIWN
jgi:hypothetical protein